MLSWFKHSEEIPSPKQRVWNHPHDMCANIQHTDSLTQFEFLLIETMPAVENKMHIHDYTSFSASLWEQNHRKSRTEDTAL